jgi:hypothetical protein
MKAPNIGFVRRHNLDGSHDSICPACLATVATTQNEAELQTHERAHLCDPQWAYRSSQVRTPTVVDRTMRLLKRLGAGV